MHSVETVFQIGIVLFPGLVVWDAILLGCWAVAASCSSGSDVSTRVDHSVMYVLVSYSAWKVKWIKYISTCDIFNFLLALADSFFPAASQFLLGHPSSLQAYLLLSVPHLPLLSSPPSSINKLIL